MAGRKVDEVQVEKAVERAEAAEGRAEQAKERALELAEAKVEQDRAALERARAVAAPQPVGQGPIPEGEPPVPQQGYTSPVAADGLVTVTLAHPLARQYAFSSHIGDRDFNIGEQITIRVDTARSLMAAGYIQGVDPGDPDSVRVVLGR